MNKELKLLTEKCNKEIQQIKEKYKNLKTEVRNKYKNKQKKEKKQHIPKKLKNMIWDKYIGKEKGIGLCYCCSEKIDSKNFEAGHIIPEAKGGPTNAENLRPICSCCNKSMGVQNMDKFKEKYMIPNNKISNNQNIFTNMSKANEELFINHVLKGFQLKDFQKPIVTNNNMYNNTYTHLFGTKMEY